MKKYLFVVMIAFCLLLSGCGKSANIVGEWKLSTKDYFEFFDDGTFERTCTNYLCSMIVEAEGEEKYDSCIIKGTYELKNKTSLYLYTTYSNCELEDEMFIYGFDKDFTYFCANSGALCMGGWQKSYDTPYHLNEDGSRIK